MDRIQNVINKTGFIDLPLKFDAGNEKSLMSHYVVDLKGNDSLIFDSEIHSVVGFLPDTSNYYAFIFHTIGDMLYPTIMTISKKGDKIDRQIICTGECAGHAAVNVISCYDSVCINQDLHIKSISKMIGTVETNDSIPKTIDLCNMLKLTGFIDKDGKIKLNRSDLIDCNK